MPFTNPARKVGIWRSCIDFRLILLENPKSTFILLSLCKKIDINPFFGKEFADWDIKKNNSGKLHEM